MTESKGYGDVLKGDKNVSLHLLGQRLIFAIGGLSVALYHLFFAMNVLLVKRLFVAIEGISIAL